MDLRRASTTMRSVRGGPHGDGRGVDVDRHDVRPERPAALVTRSAASSGRRCGPTAASGTARRRPRRRGLVGALPRYRDGERRHAVRAGVEHLVGTWVISGEVGVGDPALFRGRAPISASTPGATRARRRPGGQWPPARQLKHSKGTLGSVVSAARRATPPRRRRARRRSAPAPRATGRAQRRRRCAGWRTRPAPRAPSRG